MSPVSVDQKYLEYLFESRGRESVMKMENNKIQVIITSLSILHTYTEYYLY